MINKIFDRKAALIVIVFIALLLRFFRLGINPVSLTWDEAAWGYNAYALGIDGKDEFGRFLPFNYLESFGDFKPPMYAYLAVIPVKLFGLTEFAVRFPSALFGVLTVLVTYFLTRRLFHPRGVPQEQHHIGGVEALALLSAFLLAISPWHINLSRAAFEANVASFFIVAGVWLFLAAVQSKKWLLLLSVSSFVLSIYTFNTARIVSPILLIVLFAIFWKTLWRIKYQTIIAIALGIVLMLPVARFLVTPQASLRFKEVNIFSDIEVIERTNQEIENDKNAFWSNILHNRRFAYAVEYLKHYFDNLSPSFLFIKGDGNPKFSTQDVGQMYLIELPFLIAGILFLFRKREGNWLIVPFWLLIGIVPAATARETPHALRIETTLPTFQILTAYGLVNFIKAISNIKYEILKIQIRYQINLVVFLFFIFYFLYFIRGYYVHYPYEFSGEWQYGYKDSINYVKTVADKYNNIYVTSELGRPYIYYLFYLKTDPNIFRENSIVRRDVFGFVTVDGFGKYQFLNNTTRVDKKAKNLFINIPKNVPPGANELKKFYLKNNNISLVAYE